MPIKMSDLIGAANKMTSQQQLCSDAMTKQSSHTSPTFTNLSYLIVLLAETEYANIASHKMIPPKRACDISTANCAHMRS